VVFFELIRAFARQQDVKLGFLRVIDGEDSPPGQAEREGIEALKERGVDVLEPLRMPPHFPPRNKVAFAFHPQLSDFYPLVRHQSLLEKVIRKYRPDLLFIPWSEPLTAACARIRVPKFAYYGNPDGKSARARLEFETRHGRLKIHERIVRRRLIEAMERLHLGVMKEYDLLGDVAKNDADYYRDAGHQNAFYIRNTWIDRLGRDWEAARMRAEAQSSKRTIIGNVGKLGGTANTLGLELLGKDILPRIIRRLGSGSFRLRILGAGTLDDALVPYFGKAEVDLAGFVPDIDAALLESQVFLCVNNATQYKVGHTRYLHAWSLGCCVVAHSDVAASMPEIQHGVNALLGHDAEEIAELVELCMNDAALRLRLGRAGYDTFHKLFTAERVATQIIARARAFIISRNDESALSV
jgi:glycosyltransferase involved in cell wall biosynthesis